MRGHSNTAARGPESKNYEGQKHVVLQKYFAAGPTKLGKKNFKQLAKQLQEVLDVDSATASQLGQIVEDEGVVSRSYVEGILDVVHEQQQETQDMQFELSNGLRYVHQTAFKNADAYRVSLQECIQIVQTGFTTGQQQIIAKISSIAHNSQVDRVEFMELIEHLENKQFYQTEQNSTSIGNIDARTGGSVTKRDGSDWALIDFDEEEEYSVARDREIVGEVRVRLEAVNKEIEKCQSVLRVTNPNLLRELHNLAKPVPQVLKSYSNYSKQIHFQLASLVDQVESLKSKVSSSSSRESAELKQANETIFVLQAQLDEQQSKMEATVQRALSEFQQTLGKEFARTKLELEENNLLLENKLRETEKELRKTQNSVTSLLSANTNMENRLQIFDRMEDVKIKRMLERAIEDPDFFDKVTKAVALQEKLAAEGKCDPFADQQDIEIRDLKERVQELHQACEESDSYIIKLQNEIRELKENAPTSPLEFKSEFRLSEAELPMQGIELPESNNRPFLRVSTLGHRFDRLSMVPSAPELDFWCDTIYKLEGKNMASQRITQLEQELSIFAERTKKDQADLRDAKRSCEALDQELRLLKQERIGLESSLDITKADLSSKLIQIGNLTSQLAILQSRLNQKPTTEPAVAVVASVAVQEDASPKVDYGLDAARNKTNQILANNGLLEALKKPRPPQTEPGEAVFRNGQRVLDTLDKTTCIVDLCIPGRIRHPTTAVIDKTEEGFDFKNAYLKKVAEKTELADRVEGLQKRIVELESAASKAQTPVPPPAETVETCDLAISALVLEEDAATTDVGVDAATDKIDNTTEDSQFGEPLPSTVPLEEYQELKEKYDYRLVELDSKTEEVSQLRRRCEELIRRVAAVEEQHTAEIEIERAKFEAARKELDEVTELVVMLKAELELSRVSKIVEAPEIDEQTAISKLQESTIEFEEVVVPKVIEATTMEQAEEVINFRMSTMGGYERQSVMNAAVNFSVAAVSRLLPVAAAEQLKELETQILEYRGKLEEKDLLIENLRNMVIQSQVVKKDTKDQQVETDQLPAIELAPVAVGPTAESIVEPKQAPSKSATLPQIREIYENRIQELTEKVESHEQTISELKAQLIEIKKKSEPTFGDSIKTAIGAQLDALKTGSFFFTAKKDPEPVQPTESTFKKNTFKSILPDEVDPKKKEKPSTDEANTSNQPKGGSTNYDLLLPSQFQQEKYNPKVPQPVSKIRKPEPEKNSLYESVIMDLDPAPAPSLAQSNKQSLQSATAGQVPRQPNYPPAPQPEQTSQKVHPAQNELKTAIYGTQWSLGKPPSDPRLPPGFLGNSSQDKPLLLPPGFEQAAKPAPNQTRPDSNLSKQQHTTKADQAMRASVFGSKLIRKKEAKISSLII